MKVRTTVIRSLLGVIIMLFSCEYNYHMALSSWLGGPAYIAEKTQNTLTGEVINIDTAKIKQLLLFASDTMKIVRNGNIIEILVANDFKNWVGRRKNGKVIYSGLSKNGRKDYMFEIDDIQTMGPGNIILGTIMKDPYDEKLDTLKTVYRPY